MLLLSLKKPITTIKNDPEFVAELNDLLNNYAGRPSRLYYAEKMTKDLGGAKIYLKREDLNHTGSHKINNVLGQVLLGQTNGENTCHRGNRCRTTWCGNSNSSRTSWIWNVKYLWAKRIQIVKH